MGNYKSQTSKNSHDYLETKICSRLNLRCILRYWTGYLHLCKELQRRSEAFSTICQLDDITMLEEPDGKHAAMKPQMQTLAKNVHI